MSSQRSLALTLALALLALSAPLHAQKGDRKGHKMDSFVPESAIPPAPFLKVAEALKTFELAPGYLIEPVAAEPMVEMPAILKFDGNGRMWVCELVGYMPDLEGKGEEIPQGRIVILEDTDNDGAVDKRTVFQDKLLLPRSIYLLDDGILWANQESLFFQGRDGDKPKGKRVLVDKDYARGGNVEHKANSLVFGLDNWIYNAKSDRRYKRIAGKWVMEKTNFRGQWGIDRDDYGRLFHNSNSTLLVGDYTFPNAVFGNSNAKIKNGISARIGNNQVWPIRVNPGVNRGYINKLNGFGSNTIDSKTFKLINATGASGLAIYRGDNFPADSYGWAFVTEPCGNLVKAISIKDGAGSLMGSHPLGEKEFLASTDERFRPVNAYTAPDGSLYLLDMYHGIIQHKTYVTSYLRKQILSRKLDGPGNGHGRIYRIRHKDKARGATPRLEDLSAKELVKYLNHPNGWWRDTAQRLIVERGDASLADPLEEILKRGTPVAKLHALWSLEGLGILEAYHIPVLLNSGHDKLAASALMAALSLNADDKNTLLKDSASFKAGKESSLYQARLLAETGGSKALEALVAALLANGNNPHVKAAAFTGLKDREAVFVGVNNGRYNDREFSKWLEDAINKKHRKIEPPKIKGEHLASYQRGEKIYLTGAACIGCHGAEGTGLPNLGPPLDGSDWVNGSTERLARILLHGLMGPITVSQERYSPPAAMPGLSMNPTIKDKDIADIATYIRHAWSNRSALVEEEFIKAARAKTKGRNGIPYTEKDFK